MPKKALTDAILDNDVHKERTEKQAEKFKAEREKRRAEIKARKEANSKTAFNQLSAEEKQRYSELTQVVPNGRGYTQYQRIDALFAYLVSKGVREAGRLCNIPEGTILSWAQSSWWKSAIAIIRDLKQDELDNKYTAILDKTIHELQDRLDNGEEKATKEGIVRVKVGAKDLMLINAMAYDKRALIRKAPTEITEKVITVQDRNQILAEQFEKIGRSSPIIEGEILDASTSSQEER